MVECEASVALWRELGDKGGQAVALISLARVVHDQGNYERAMALYQEGLGLVLMLDAGDKRGIAECVERVARVVAAFEQQRGGGRRNLGRAAQLWGAAEALREAIRAPLPPVDRIEHEQAVANVRLPADDPAFAAAWAAGRAMPLEQAIAAALAPLSRPERGACGAWRPPVAAALPAGLTAREVEVLRLVAQGLTNAEIAQALILSPYTINAHLRSIFGKLDVPSRSAAARYAVEHHLV
jgi:DNA-binding CsgD family transcriptional regulator